MKISRNINERQTDVKQPRKTHGNGNPASRRVPTKAR
ncbi:DUF4023 family protein [Luminiphilus sp. nBUS_07]